MFRSLFQRTYSAPTSISISSSGNGKVASYDDRPDLIGLSDVNKAYQTPAGDFWALRDVNLNIRHGEFVAILGKSGAGKSTLINMLTGIDKPSGGTIQIGDDVVNSMSEEEIAGWRGQNVGVIFQFFQLMPMLTCAENVMLPMDFCNLYRTRRERYNRAMFLLEQMEISDQSFKLPGAISGGQRQRVAIARALANDPALIAADEPTGNLDSKTADSVFRLFEQLVDQGKTIVMVTHDKELAARVPRQITMVDGQIVDDIVR